MSENAYDKYKRLEDLPVDTKVILPPEGVTRKGIIQFIHGMAEHKARYFETMQYFADRGYICAIHDHRGHGKSMKNDKELGYFGENGYVDVVEDAHAVTAYLKNNYPDLKFILLGHSFGSVVARAYIKKYDYELDMAFISGCPGDNKAKVFGLLFVELITIFKKSTEVDELVHKLFADQYDKKYKKLCKETGKKYVVNGQVCSVEEVVEKYNKDRYSGFKYTLNGYYTIMKVMTNIYNGSVDKWTRKNLSLPITFLSGAQDVYMINKKAFLSAVDRMKKIGYTDVHYKLYEGMYHEILNEKDKEKVYEDILTIIEKN